MRFDFCIPVTWTDIISAIAAIATVVAVWVAICGVRKSSRQIEDALKIHEQSKNIGLFDKRLQLLNNIIDNIAVNDEELGLLFSEEIVFIYEKMKKHKSNGSTIEYKIDEYIENLSLVKQTEFSKKQLKMTFIELLEIAEQTGNYYTYIDYCNKNELSFVPLGGYETVKYNFKEMSDKLGAELSLESECKNKLIAEMKSYISKSIEKIDR